MFVRNAAALLFTVSSLSWHALAELITVTQYASTCSAIYTTGTRSVTIVQSTTTVVPIPYDDAAWNGGTPFVLEIEPDTATSPLGRRQNLIGRSWLTLDGNTSTDPLSAGQYKIRGGQLMSVNGSYISTDLNVMKQPFSIMTTVGSISTSFSFKEGVLNWTSPRFTGGRVKFCKLPADLVDDAQVLAQFIGPVAPQSLCAPIRMKAQPCDEVNPLTSSSATPTGTMSVSSSVDMQSMTSGPPGQYTPPPFTYAPGSSSAGPGPSVSSLHPPYINPTGSASSSSLPSSIVPFSASIAPGASSSGSPPTYGSQTISSVTSSSSASSSPSQTFAPSGSPIGPINPPYSVSNTISESKSSSLSLSDGGVRTSGSVSSLASSFSSPPIYTPPGVSTSMSMLMSESGSSSAPSSSLPSMTLASSGTRPPGYTLPAVTPSTSSSSSAVPSEAPPVEYPGQSLTTSASTSPSSPPISSSSTVTSSSSSSGITLPFYTSSPQPCPQGNNSIYVDTAGYAYTIYCRLDSLPSSYIEPLFVDFAACIQRCDFDPQCGAISHDEGSNTCYLKQPPQSYFPGTFDLAVRVAGAPVTPPIYTAPSSSTSSSGVPQQYGSSSTSSSMVMPPSSSSMMSSFVLPSPTMFSSMNSSSSMTSSVASSSSSSEVQEEYPGATTTSSSSSSEVHADYSGATKTSSSSTSSSMTSNMYSSMTASSSSSSEVPGQYEPTHSSASSSTSSELPDQYEQTITSSSASSEAPDQYEQSTSSTMSSSSSPIPTSSSTISSSSSSASAASSTIPYSSYLVLPSPTPCDYGDPEDYDEDDSYCELDLPFDMQLYGQTFQRTFPSSNGYVGLNRGSSQFQTRQFPNTAIPENTIAPFNDDIMLYGRKNPRQGLYYQIEGGTKVTFEWYMGRSAQLQADKDRLSQSIYHFTMEYDSAVPNTFIYTYYQVGNESQSDEGVNGAYATVGMQGLNANGQTVSTTYSFRSPQITPGLRVQCSGTVNRCVALAEQDPPLVDISLGG